MTTETDPRARAAADPVEPRQKPRALRRTGAGHDLPRLPRMYGQWYLDKLWVEPDPRETSPAMVWHGTDPFKPDETISTNTNCVGWEMTIGGGPVPAAFAVNGQVCDTESFGPKLYAEDGHHAGVWNDSNCVPSGTVRKVTSLVLVRVNQGKLPLWSSDRRGANAYSSRESC